MQVAESNVVRDRCLAEPCAYRSTQYKEYLLKIKRTLDSGTETFLISITPLSCSLSIREMRGTVSK
jgi:hypothetical protein